MEAAARAVFARYNFGEIRTPVLEATELFARGVGEETDIVSKEMYTWEDRARAASEKPQSLTLRPKTQLAWCARTSSTSSVTRGSCRSCITLGRSFGVSDRRRDATGSSVRLARR